MIILLIILAWMIPALAVFRRLGYYFNQPMLDGPHQFKSICTSCTCSKCGKDSFAHHSNCQDAHWEGMHPSAFSGALVGSLFFWPAVLIAYAGSKVKSYYGINPGPFFVPPPVVETKEQKRERLMAQRELEATEREKAIRAKEMELGVGEYANY